MKLFRRLFRFNNTKQSRWVFLCNVFLKTLKLGKILFQKENNLMFVQTYKDYNKSYSI